MNPLPLNNNSGFLMSDSLLIDPPKEDGISSCCYSISPIPSDPQTPVSSQIQARRSVCYNGVTAIHQHPLLFPNLSQKTPSPPLRHRLLDKDESIFYNNSSPSPFSNLQDSASSLIITTQEPQNKEASALFQSKQQESESETDNFSEQKLHCSYTLHKPAESTKSRLPPINLPLLKIPTIDVPDDSVCLSPGALLAENIPASFKDNRRCGLLVQMSQQHLSASHTSQENCKTLNAEEEQKEKNCKDVAFGTDSMNNKNFEERQKSEIDVVEKRYCNTLMSGTDDNMSLNCNLDCFLSLSKSFKRKKGGPIKHIQNATPTDSSKREEQQQRQHQNPHVDIVICHPYYPAETLDLSFINVHCRMLIVPSPNNPAVPLIKQANMCKYFNKLPAVLSHFIAPLDSIVVFEFFRANDNYSIACNENEGNTAALICEGRVFIPSELLYLVGKQDLFVPTGSQSYLTSLFKDLQYNSISLEIPLNLCDNEENKLPPIITQKDAERHLVTIAKNMNSKLTVENIMSSPYALIQVKSCSNFHNNCGVTSLSPMYFRRRALSYRPSTADSIHGHPYNHEGLVGKNKRCLEALSGGLSTRRHCLFKGTLVNRISDDAKYFSYQKLKRRSRSIGATDNKHKSKLPTFQETDNDNDDDDDENNLCGPGDASAVRLSIQSTNLENNIVTTKMNDSCNRQVEEIEGEKRHFPRRMGTNNSFLSRVSSESESKNSKDQCTIINMQSLKCSGYSNLPCDSHHHHAYRQHILPPSLSSASSSLSISETELRESRLHPSCRPLPRICTAHNDSNTLVSVSSQKSGPAPLPWPAVFLGSTTTSTSRTGETKCHQLENKLPFQRNTLKSARTIEHKGGRKIQLLENGVTKLCDDENNRCCCKTCNYKCKSGDSDNLESMCLVIRRKSTEGTVLSSNMSLDSSSVSSSSMVSSQPQLISLGQIQQDKRHAYSNILGCNTEKLQKHTDVAPQQNNKLFQHDCRNCDNLCLEYNKNIKCCNRVVSHRLKSQGNSDFYENCCSCYFEKRLKHHSVNDSFIYERNIHNDQEPSQSNNDPQFLPTAVRNDSKGGDSTTQLGHHQQQKPSADDDCTRHLWGERAASLYMSKGSNELLVASEQQCPYHFIATTETPLMNSNQQQGSASSTLLALQNQYIVKTIPLVVSAVEQAKNIIYGLLKVVINNPLMRNDEQSKFLAKSLVMCSHHFEHSQILDGAVKRLLKQAMKALSEAHHIMIKRQMIVNLNQNTPLTKMITSSSNNPPDIKAQQHTYQLFKQSNCSTLQHNASYLVASQHLNTGFKGIVLSFIKGAVKRFLNLHIITQEEASQYWNLIYSTGCSDKDEEYAKNQFAHFSLTKNKNSACVVTKVSGDLISDSNCEQNIHADPFQNANLRIKINSQSSLHTSIIRSAILYIMQYLRLFSFGQCSNTLWCIPLKVWRCLFCWLSQYMCLKVLFSRLKL